MKRLILLGVAAIMAATNMNAQMSDETQGLGGLVLDSIYNEKSDGVIWTKSVYEYTKDKQPKVLRNFAFFDENNQKIDTPRHTDYITYFYDEQNRMQKEETCEVVDGKSRVLYIEEIVEYDAESGLPALIYSYGASESDPESTPQLERKGVVTKYHGNVGIEEMQIYMMQNDEWQLMASVIFTYDEQGHVLKEAMELGGMQLVTENEYDDHGQIIRKVVKQVQQFFGETIVLDSSETTFTNEYYEDGNLKTSALYQKDALIETKHYFWGKGTISGILQAINNQWLSGKWFDLNGRIINGKPTQKGVYIYNGKKTVCK